MSERQKSFFFESNGRHDDPLPHLPIETGSKKKGVGIWVPRDKHALLAEYLFATRLVWRGGTWTHRVLIDPFCGPGRLKVRNETITRDGGVVVAWRESVAGGFPFTHVFIGDKDAERVNACEARLRALDAPVRAFPGPADETVRKMVDAVPKDSLCLAYVDPYNLELLSFDILKALARLRVDLVVNFSTMDLQRNVEMEFNPASTKRFDGVAPEWRTDPTMLAVSKANVKLEFFRYWMGLVLGLGFKYSREMPVAMNDSGHGIYRLVFFAKHHMPVRVWSDVARDQNFDLFRQ